METDALACNGYQLTADRNDFALLVRLSLKEMFSLCQTVVNLAIKRDHRANYKNVCIVGKNRLRISACSTIINAC